MTRNPLRFASTVALASGLLAQTPAQVPDAGAAGSSTTASNEAGATIEITTRLVTLNVVVHDRGGNPVDGLSKADFEVKDAGRPQAISVFTINHLPRPGTQAAATLPRNIVTNVPSSQAGVPASVTVLLIDSYNTSVMDQGYVKQQLVKCVSKLLPGNQVAVYTLNAKGFGIAHDFTNNAESLRAAVAKGTVQSSHELEASVFARANTGMERIDAMIDESNLIISNYLTRNRIVNTCQALRLLADHLSGILGRKNLIWITGGIPMELPGSLERSGDGDQHFAPYVVEAAQALNNANVAVYPTDARGMMPQSSYQASRQQPDPGTIPRPRTTDGRSNMPSLPALDTYIHYDSGAMTMATLAEMTGGKAFYDLAQAVRQAIDDSSVTYTLGYYVAASDWNNKYHRIRVDVRRSSMHVRTKKGYLARDKPTPNSVQLEAALNDAVWSPLDSTRLSVTARIDPSPALPNASRFSVGIDPTQMRLRQEDGRYRGRTDFLFV